MRRGNHSTGNCSRSLQPQATTAKRFPKSNHNNFVCFLSALNSENHANNIKPSFMLASDSGSVLRPKLPIPTIDPTRSLLRRCCCFFDPGSRPARPTLSLKMELLRRMGRGCFKAEADSAGQDFFDAAAAAAPNPAPHHLVIMVNGIIGR